MKNAERIIVDVAHILLDYESRRVSPEIAVKKILEMTKDSCEHCVYKGENCKERHDMTCFEGFSLWLRGEA